MATITPVIKIYHRLKAAATKALVNYSTAIKLPALAPGSYTLTIRNRDITDSKRVTIIN